MSTSLCNGCGAPMEWIVTAGGKRMPVDPEPVLYVAGAGGGLRLVTSTGQVVAARLATDCDLAAGLEIQSGRTSHFATCPKAARFRRSS